MIVKFAHPERLWLFAAMAVLVLWWLRSLWRRRRSWQALAQRGRPPREGAVWWLLTIACLIVAVAQPRWGRVGPAPAPGHDVVFLVDVSRSMGAEDAVPSRLGVALEYAEKLVDALGTGLDNRAAVVAFAGRGLLRCPLTENLGAVKAALRRLRPGAVQPGGTDLAAGLDAALEALGTESHAQGQSIVIFSDGEDLADRWKSRLDLLLDREVTVYAVTIGDADRGHPVPARPDSSERLTYQGKPVESRRSDAALRAIADQTKGVVVALGLASGDPTVLYRNQIEPSARRKELVPRVADMAEHFGVFLGGALSCIIAACWPPRRGWSWPVRLGWGWTWFLAWPWSRRARLSRRLARDVARFMLVLAAGPILALTIGAAQPPSNKEARRSAARQASPANMTPTVPSTPRARESVDQGRAAYAAGKYEAALSAFEEAVRFAPDDAIPRYDTAAALFALGRFDEARVQYREARKLADAALATKIDYALGNTALALRDVPAAIAAYDSCIASTATGRDLDAVRQDAAINREFAVRQAQSPAIPQEPGADESSPSRPGGRRSSDRRSGGDEPFDESDSGDESSATTPGSDQESRQDSRERIRRRRASASSGGRNTPPAAGGGTPEDRLDAALANLRDAQSRRLPDDNPPPTPGSDGRDW